MCLAIPFGSAHVILRLDADDKREKGLQKVARMNGHVTVVGLTAAWNARTKPKSLFELYERNIRNHLDPIPVIQILT
jgi:hypothetical protein